MARKTRTGRRVKEKGERGIVGRENTFCKTKFDAILETIKDGRPVTKAAVDHGVKPSTFFSWIQIRPELFEPYRMAKQVHAAVIRDESYDIADDGTNDYVEKKIRDRTFIALNSENIARSKLRVEFRLKMADIYEQDRPPPGHKSEDKGADVSAEAIAALERLAAQKVEQRAE